MRVMGRPPFTASSPAPKQAEQIFGVGLHLLLRLPLDARDQTGNQPTLLTELQDTDILLGIMPARRQSTIASTRMSGRFCLS
jgi:hypothetical protein